MRVYLAGHREDSAALAQTVADYVAAHLGLTPARLVTDTLETALLAVALEVAPDGRAGSALDELMRLLHAMAANGRLRYDEHFGTDRERRVLIPLDSALPEARRYARETGTPLQLMGHDAYRQQVAEAAKQAGAYVLETAGRAYIGNRRRRGVLIDPAILERRLQLDRAVWANPEEGSDEDEEA